jgi:hypothetical protein
MDTLTVQPSAHSALSRLAVFVGEWRWEAALDGQPFGWGKAKFEWIEGGTFLLERETAEQPEFPNASMIIGCDNDLGTYSWLQSDSRGISRIYHMTLQDGVWKQWRDAPGFAQRFTGIFHADGKQITGRWEQSSDGVNWAIDFDLTYTKVA